MNNRTSNVQRNAGSSPSILELQQSVCLRYETFGDWSNKNVSAQDLAEAGFVSLHEDDKVVCVFCSTTIRAWERDDIPATEHKRIFPHCPGIPLNWVLPPQSKEIINHKVLSTRVASFKSSWPHRTGKLLPQSMAEAGFYYIGEADKVRCFICHCELHCWEPTDDPWEEHKKWHSTCPLVKNRYGRSVPDEGGALTEVSNRQPGVLQQENAGPRGSQNGDIPTVVEQLAAMSLGERPETGAVECGVASKTSMPKTDNDNNRNISCIICQDEEKCLVFFPCSHLCCCSDCGYHVSTCPICRSVIQNRVKVFL